MALLAQGSRAQAAQRDTTRCHGDPMPQASPEYGLFADAKVAENHVQDVLDIDPAGQPAERAGGDPQLLGQQILAAGHFASLRPLQGRQYLLKRAPVAFAGHQRRFGPRQETLGLAGQLTQKLVKTLASERPKY